MAAVARSWSVQTCQVRQLDLMDAEEVKKNQ